MLSSGSEEAISQQANGANGCPPKNRAASTTATPQSMLAL